MTDLNHHVFFNEWFVIIPITRLNKPRKLTVCATLGGQKKEEPSVDDSPYIFTSIILKAKTTYAFKSMSTC